MTKPDPPIPDPAGLSPVLPEPGCPDALALASYLDGRAEEQAVQRLESHLATCVTCLAAVCDARQAAAVEDDVVVPARVRERAKALVSSAAEGGGARFSWRLADWRAAARWSVAAAAALAMSVLGYQAGLAAGPIPAPATTSVAAAPAEDSMVLDVFSTALTEDLSRAVFAASLPETMR